MPGLLRHTVHLARMLALSESILRHPGVFELLALDFILDTEDNLWLLDVVSSPSLSASNEKIAEDMSSMVKSLIDIELTLDNDEKFDQIVSQSSMKWVYDGRKNGPDRYHGLIEPECF